MNRDYMPLLDLKPHSKHFYRSLKTGVWAHAETAACAKNCQAETEAASPLPICLAVDYRSRPSKCSRTVLWPPLCIPATLVSVPIQPVNMTP